MSRKRKQDSIPGVGKLTTIFVKGRGLIQVRDTTSGLIDENANEYIRGTDGTYKKVPSQIITRKGPKVLKKVEPYDEVYGADGSTWRNQPNSEGKFELVLVAEPKKINSLSPLIRSGFGKKGSK